MRPSQTILILSLFFAIQSHALDQNKQNKQQPFEYTPPKLTDEELSQARDGFQDLISKVPVNTVQPLLTTIDGYCNSFDALCAYSCQERLQTQSQSEQDNDDDDDEEENIDQDDIDAEDNKETDQVNGCSNTKAKSVIQAKASCKCAGLDMTDRINFALVGGIVSSKIPSTSSKYSEFSAQDITANITTLPESSSFQTIMTVAKNICNFIDRLNNLSPGLPVSSPPVPTTPPSPGGIFGFVSNIIPSIGTPSDLSPLIPLLNAIVGNGNYGIATNIPKTNGATVPPSVTSKPPPTVAPPVARPAAPPVARPAAPPVAPSNPKGNNGGEIFGWLPRVFMETDKSGNAIDHSPTEQDHSQEDALIDKDGYIAKITRVQNRKAKDL
ncbi:hypothetical protein BGZ76_001653 [Entomortierella beljakovae]|nr:hypothetical protein BGZ76_001653 [Entomortierella beljakovae]